MEQKLCTLSRNIVNGIALCWRKTIVHIYLCPKIPTLSGSVGKFAFTRPGSWKQNNSKDSCMLDTSFAPFLISLKPPLPIRHSQNWSHFFTSHSDDNLKWLQRFHMLNRKWLNQLNNGLFIMRAIEVTEPLSDLFIT